MQGVTVMGESGLPRVVSKVCRLRPIREQIVRLRDAHHSEPGEFLAFNEAEQRVHVSQKVHQTSLGWACFASKALAILRCWA